MLQILNALGAHGVNPFRVIIWNNGAVCYSSVDCGPALAQAARDALVSVLRKIPPEELEG